MMPAEESQRERVGIGLGRSEVGSASHGDPIHACVDLVVLLVIVASAVGCLASAVGIW